MTNAQTTSDELGKQNRAASEKFLSTLAGLSDTLQNVAEKFKNQQTGHLENFETLINMLLADLKDFTQQQKNILSNAANSNAAQIFEAVKAFREIIDNHNTTSKKTFMQVQKLLDDTEKFLQLPEDASTSLKQAAEPVSQSTLQLARNLTATSEQMKNLSAANQITRQNLSDLSTRLSAFVNNFNDIADELERATKIIQDSLENYNYKMNNGLTDALENFNNNRR